MDWAIRDYDAALAASIKEAHGNMTAAWAMQDALPRADTGNLVAAVYDFGGEQDGHFMLYVANARADGESGPLKALSRQYVAFDMSDLFEDRTEKIVENIDAEGTVMTPCVDAEPCQIHVGASSDPSSLVVSWVTSIRWLEPVLYFGGENTSLSKSVVPMVDTYSFRDYCNATTCATGEPDSCTRDWEEPGFLYHAILPSVTELSQVFYAMTDKRTHTHTEKHTH